MHVAEAGNVKVEPAPDEYVTWLGNKCVASHVMFTDGAAAPLLPPEAAAAGKYMYPAFEPGVTTTGPAWATSIAAADAAAEIHFKIFFTSIPFVLLLYPRLRNDLEQLRFLFIGRDGRCCARTIHQVLVHKLFQ